MKWCPKCKTLLPLSSFSISTLQKRSGAYCKACRSEYGKAHYRRNATLHKRRRTINRRRYAKRNREQMIAFMRAQSCIDCGETDFRVLEFDHVRGEKYSEVSVMVGQGWSWRRIAVEIAKCEVRCANCHRRRTARQFGWWQGRFGT